MIKFFKLSFFCFLAPLLFNCSGGPSRLGPNPGPHTPTNEIVDPIKLSGTADGSGGDTRYSSLEDISNYFQVKNEKVVLTQKVQTVFHRLIKLKKVLVYYQSVGAPPTHKYQKLSQRFDDQDIELDIDHLFNYLGVSVSTIYRNINENQKLLNVIDRVFGSNDEKELITEIGKMIFIPQDEPCRSLDGRETAMAIDGQGRICVSINLLQRLPLEALEVEIISLASHEYIHYLGIDSEELAFEFQNFIAINNKYFISDRSLQDLSEIQDKLALVLTSNLAHQSSIRSATEERAKRCEGLYSAIKSLQSDLNYFAREFVGHELDSLLTNYCFVQSQDDYKDQVIGLSETIYKLVDDIGKAKGVIGSILSPFYLYSNDLISEFVHDSIQLDKILLGTLKDDGMWNSEVYNFAAASKFYLKINNSEVTFTESNCEMIKDPFIHTYGRVQSRIRSFNNPLQPNLCSIYNLNTKQSMLFILTPHSTDGLIEVGFRERPSTYDFVFNGIYNLRVFLVNKEEPTETSADDYVISDLSNLPMRIKSSNNESVHLMNRRVFSVFTPFYMNPGVVSYVQSIFTSDLNEVTTLELQIPESYDFESTEIVYSSVAFEIEFGFKQD